MNGTKQIVNETDAMVKVTVAVRKGSDPANKKRIAAKSAHPNSTETFNYGSEENPFINSLEVFASLNGKTTTYGIHVDHRSDKFDNEMNMFNTILITAEGEKIHFHTENR